ncbi:O-antigen polymerase [Geotoga petraea]|uniref:Oligosaccharide repeat unit polymerase n=1 Tax=Geotoga petraea TaxID=28234 RepID=A0A1G6PIC7_9BACT|nr:O-antigen polymerase [Geotoga petraea]SDC80002.1 oligosaccharide repeat unit polymerase [Geotoga petraea]
MTSVITKNNNLKIAYILKTSVMLLITIVSLFIYGYNLTIYTTVNLSFFINLLFIIVFSAIHIFSRKISLMDSVFLVFFYTFFWLAPLLQTETGRYPNTMPFDERLIVLTNLYLLIFGVSYFSFKNLLHFRIKIKKINPNYYKLNDKTFNIIFIASILILLVFSDYLISNIFSNVGIGLNLERSSGLILNTFIFSFPLYIAYHSSLNFRNSKKYLFLFILSLIILIIFKNPFFVKRNALGPIYLTLFFLFYKNRFNNLKIFLFLVLILTIIFPFSQAFTHNRDLVAGDLLNTFITRVQTLDVKYALTSLDYDAWSNFMASIKYSEINDITYGRQLLGSVLFWVPRSIWSNKPIGSGALVAENMLMTKYNMWFSNLSMPFPGEGYINFGIIGIFMFSFILSIISKITDEFFKYNDLRLIFSLYVSFHMIFMLRGDLMSSLAYLVGILLAIFFVPVFLNKIFYKRGKR